MQFFFKHIRYFKFAIPVLAFLLYSNSILNKYNLDDELVTRNHKLTSQGIKAIPEILSSFYYEDNQGYKYDYRPIVHISFAIEHQFFGEVPYISHFINVLLYTLLSFLIFLFLSQLLPKEMILLAWLATIIFVFHPMHSEVVASIKNRDEILAFIFLAISGILYIKASVGGKNLFLIVPALVLFILGLFSKIIIISFAVLIPLAIIIFKKPKFIVWLALVLPLITFSILSTFLSSKEKLILWLFSISFLYLIQAIVQDWRFEKKILQRVYKFPSKIFCSLSFTYFKIVAPIINGVFNIFLYNKKIFLLIIGPVWKEFSILLNTELSSNKASIPLIITGSALISCLYALILFEIDQIWVTINFIALILLFFLAREKKTSLIISLFVLLSLPILEESKLLHLTGLAFLVPLSVFILNYSNQQKVTILTALTLLYVTSFFVFSLPTEVKIAIPILLCIMLLVIVIEKKWMRLIATFLFLVISMGILSDIFQLFNIKINSFKIPLFFLSIGLFWFLLKTGTRILKPYLFILYFSISIASFLNFANQGNLENLVLKPKDSVKEVNLKKEGISYQNLIDVYNYFIVENLDYTNNYLAENYVGFVNINDEDRPLEFVESPVNMSDSPSERLGTSLYIIKFYIKNLFIPHKMAYYYGYAFITPHSLKEPSSVIVLIFVILFVIISLYLIYGGQIVIGLAMNLLWIPLIQISTIFYPIAGMVGDRYLFLPSLGFSILLAYPFFQGISKGKVKVSALLFSLLILAYTLITVQRNFQWKDKLTLFENDIHYVNNSAQAHALLAGAYMELANKSGTSESSYLALSTKAIEQYTKAIAIYPKFLNCHYYLGLIYESIGNSKNASIFFENSIKLDPNFSVDPYLKLGQIYFLSGEYEQSAEYYEKALELNFKNPEIYNTLLICYMNTQQNHKAIFALERGLELFPKDFHLNLNLSKVYYSLNNIEMAKKYFGIARSIDPYNQEITTMIGVLGE